MLSESERDGLLSLGVLNEWATGSIMLMEGDTTKHVLVLDAGWVKVVAALEEGGQALLALRSRGDLVGEQAAVENAPRSASVVSAIPVRAYVIQREPFLRYLTEHPRVHHAVTQNAVREIALGDPSPDRFRHSKIGCPPSPGAERPRPQE